MLKRHFTLAILCADVLAALCALAAPPAQAQSPNDRSNDPTKVTRADLGRAYLRLERAYFADPPQDGERIAQINQSFDTATLAFFGGRFAETVQTIDELTASLMGETMSSVVTLGMSLKPIVEPPVVSLEEPAPFEIRVVSLYPVETPPTDVFRPFLELVHAEGKVTIDAPLDVGRTGDSHIDTVVTIDPSSTHLAQGSYAIRVSAGSESGIEIGRLAVVARPLDAIRSANEARLDAIDAREPAIVAAVAACRDRNALLNDRPSEQESSQFLADANALIGQINAEIEALAGGRDPYRRRAGDYWRTVSAGEAQSRIPIRVFAPPAAVTDNRVPLVVTLHGAGADENIFMEGYGAGRIKELAEEHGFLVVSPSTNALRGDGERFDHLIDELAYDYQIDPAAIYVLGHSMGAGATIKLAGERTDAIAAACCLAGGGRSRAETLPPTLVVAAELDKIVAAEALRKSAQTLIDAGLPVEFREVPHYGHTLMVGATLPDAVEWLLSRSGGDGTNEER